MTSLAPYRPDRNPPDNAALAKAVQSLREGCMVTDHELTDVCDAVRRLRRRRARDRKALAAVTSEFATLRQTIRFLRVDLDALSEAVKGRSEATAPAPAAEDPDRPSDAEIARDLAELDRERALDIVREMVRGDECGTLLLSLVRGED